MGCYSLCTLISIFIAFLEAHQLHEVNRAQLAGRNLSAAFTVVVCAGVNNRADVAVRRALAVACSLRRRNDAAPLKWSALIAFCHGLSSVQIEQLQAVGYRTIEVSDELWL